MTALFLNEAEKKIFGQIVERSDRAFNPAENMLTEWRGRNGYHSRLEECTVHGIVGSLEYACDLMCRGRVEDIKRVEGILQKVLPLQDRDPDSETFGIWPYFLEESLSDMDAPDWNMADFNAKRLYYLLKEHGEKLSGESRENIKEALEMACKSIMRRDMGPWYSNISIMGAYVVMAARELLEEEELQAYALKRMRELCKFNLEHGALQEYNSPSYTFIVLSDLAAVFCHVKNKEFLALAEKLNDMVWHCLAEHFHYRTAQWAGPHSRFYGMLQNEQILIQIQRALNNRIHLVDLDAEGMADALPMCFFLARSHCPEELIPYFAEETKESFRYTRYLWTEDEREDDIAASYLAEDCTLGTFQKAMFWNQRRSHISYFGTREKPVYCCMRCLHDFYDYASGLLATAQEKNRALTVFGFGLDGGDSHPDLDKVKNGCIKAHDLRVRFEIGGAVSGLCVCRQENEFFVEVGSCTIHILVSLAVLGERKAACTVTEEEAHVEETGGHKETKSVKCIDIVLYQGEESELDFRSMEQCFGVAGFEILHEGDTPGRLPDVTIDNNIVTAAMGNLKVSAPAKADTMKGFLHHSSAWVEGINYLELKPRK